MHIRWSKSAVTIETPKRALYHESLILNEFGFRCFPFQKHFRTQLMLLFCLIPKKSLTATVLHAYIMPTHVMVKVIWFLSILRNVDGKVKMDGPCGLNYSVQGPKNGRSCMTAKKVEGHVWNWTSCESKQSWYPNRPPQHFLTVYFLATELSVQLPVVRPRTNHMGSKDRPLSFFFRDELGQDSSKPTINLRRFCPQRPCPQRSVSTKSRRFVYLEVVMTHGGRRINHLRSNASFALYTLSRQQF